MKKTIYKSILITALFSSYIFASETKLVIRSLKAKKIPTKIENAIKTGNLKDIKESFQKGKINIENNPNLMHLAAFHEQKELVQYLLDQGVSANERYKTSFLYRADENTSYPKEKLVPTSYSAVQHHDSGIHRIQGIAA